MPGLDEFIDPSTISGGSGGQWYKEGSGAPVIKKAETITNTISGECSLVSDEKSTGVCSSEIAISKMRVLAGDASGNAKQTLEKTKEITGCEDEKCVIKSKEFRGIAGDKLARAELAKNFKLDGPKDVSLLNNFNIDNTLKQWNMKHKDFYPYNFNMLNFDEKGDSLAVIDARDLYSKGYRMAGCIINTDVYSGRGKHWMALFYDMRSTAEWSVEFFNSSGNPPQKEFDAWLDKTKKQLEDISGGIPVKKVVVCKFAHQKSRTECGVYSLYYIWNRINGVGYEKFSKNVISDVAMFEFRQYLFSGDGDYTTADGNFDYEKFKSRVDVKWENIPSRFLNAVLGGGANMEKQLLLDPRGIVKGAGVVKNIIDL